jgi:hypothetical protein
MQFEIPARTISFLYQNPSGHHTRFKPYTNPFPCHSQPLKREHRTKTVSVRFFTRIFAQLVRSPLGQKSKRSGFCYFKDTLDQFVLTEYCLVWATELSLAAIGLIFPALVLGYYYFIVESMTY